MTLENLTGLNAPIGLGIAVVHNILFMVIPSRHVRDEELERYSLGGAVGEEFAQLEEHILICDACRTRLEECDLIARSMAGTAARWRSEHPRSGSNRWSRVRLLLPL